jgi:LysR family transcriptional regulator, glycine cleavage system transcriptional activator
MRRMPPLGAIEAFVTAARAGSAKNAAEQLALSPSALSRRIQTLEGHLGELLFERRHQALALTLAGEALLAALGPALDGLGRAFEAFGSNGDTTRIRLGVLPLYAHSRLMPHLAEFRARYPDISVDLDTGPALISRLGENLDAAIVLSDEIDARFYSRQLDHNHIVAIGARALRDSDERPRNVGELVRHQLLMHRDMPSGLPVWLDRQGINPGQIKADFFDSGQLMLDAAAAGMGIAILLDSLVDPHDERLALLLEDPVESPYNYFFVCRRAALTRRPIKLFHDWVVDVLAQPPSPSPG